MHRLLLGADDFYADLFRSMTVPYVPVEWRKDEAQRGLAGERRAAGPCPPTINLYRVRGHLIANLDRSR